MKTTILKCLLLMSLVVPTFVAGAQDDQQLADIQISVSLTAQQTIPDLGLTFSYPDGWYADESDGITILADPADLTAATDGDPATRANSPFISVDVIPLAAIGLTPQNRLNEVQQVVTSIISFSPQDSFDLPVVARRSITLFGADANGDYGFVTFWTHDENLVLFVFSAASAQEVQSWSSTWKEILASFTPSQALPLDESVKSRFLSTTIEYPAGWTMFDGTDRFGLFLKPSDRDLWIAGQDVYMESLAITALYQPAKDLVEVGILANEGDIEELYKLNASFLGWQPQTTHVTEAILFGSPAFIIETVNPNQFYVYAVMGFVDGNVYLIHAASPDLTEIEAFKPTFDLMMMNFHRD